MKLLLEWEGHSEILDPQNAYVLGRDPAADIFIDSPRLSRTHLRFTFNGDSWLLEDLGSTNGTYLRSTRIDKLIISKNTLINLGGLENFRIKISVVASETFEINNRISRNSQETTLTKGRLEPPVFESNQIPRIRLQGRIKIGRDLGSDWLIDNLNVSRNHAEIIQNSTGRYEIVDLKSTNGTYLNGAQIKREILKVGDVISIGGLQRRFTSEGLQVLEGIEGTTISLKNIHFSIKGKELLQDISLNLGPRTLTAIVGPSGAGKSTLLGVLTGRTKPSRGNVYFNEIDLHEQFNELSKQIGSVPQADILHTRLTVKEALDYGAKLRLPSDTSRAERNRRVMDVMEQLELTERADLRIDRLSGGQRKRASIGLELLTSPQLLVLDEPTSGLDPGLDAHVMETLRKLADAGQTVVLVTHSVDNLSFCDNVILLASGGKLAYAGPSSTVFSNLEKNSWAEVFRTLASPDEFQFSKIRFENPVSTEISNKHVSSRKQNSLRQLLTLSSRYLRVIFSDKFYLALLISIPVVIGFISYAAGSEYGFGPGTVTKSGFNYNPFAQSTILVLILGSIFIGLSTSIQEIVKENPIRKREQAVGIRSSTYLGSKILILGFIVNIQIAIFTFIVLWGRPMPVKGKWIDSSKIEITIICAALGLSSMLLGLFISALLTSSEQAMPTLVGTTMIQVVLSGALPLQTKGLIDVLSKLISSYWANNALSASVDIVQLNLTSDVDLQARWISTQANVVNSLIMVGTFSMIFCIGALVRIHRSR